MTESNVDSIQDTLSRLSLAASLNNSGTSSATANASMQRNQDSVTINRAELERIINARVQEILNPFREFEAQNSSDNFPGGSIRDVDKIPDIVSSLREFSGKTGDFNSWRKSVDRIFEIFSSIQGTPKYYAILHTVRHKITGEADTALESYRTPLNWDKIKKVLMMHYSDKRDIGTLEYQMTTLLQKNMSITEFYKKVYEHLSLLLDKISCLEISEEGKNAMINSYRGKALDAFIRGLNGDLPKLLSIREPSSLPQALNLCQRLDNINFRTNYVQNHSRVNTHKPPILMPHRPQHSPRSSFYPELAQMPTYFRQNPTRPQVHSFQRPNIQIPGQHYQRPNFSSDVNNRQHFHPKPPEPMDVDQSMRSKNINYQNFSKNPQVVQKRPNLNNSIQGLPAKIQRNYFINSNSNNNQDYPLHYNPYETSIPCNTVDVAEQADTGEPIPMQFYPNEKEDNNNDNSEPESDNVYFLD